MSTPKALIDYAALAEPLFKKYLDEQGAKLPASLQAPHGLLTNYVLRGGKRLRGALVLLGCEAAGGPRGLAVNASLGCELLHAYLLIHDDFMDRDELRRGGPTLHVSLGQEHGAHLGGSVALLLGSICQAWAHELVLSTKAEPARVLRAAQIFEEAIAEVTAGQMLDLLASRREPTSAEVLEIEQHKTGGYTFELPLLLGASLAGAPAALTDALRGYARPLGQAFQIADDLLGTFGAPEVTGKPNASDLREGKRTLLITRALERATAEDAKTLRDGLGRAEMTDADADLLRDLLRRTGAAGAAKADAERLCAEALRSLESPAIPQAVRTSLAEIATHSVRRAS
ncbi:MAG TPA: polyprenyl synthetase family protein [Myxococcales bacterium]|nr:polyprenyl synthetase family protein [Myxococcales bacterium]